jgi:tRNA threonylcarbamoyladenosine biosynthesis protein TsaB
MRGENHFGAAFLDGKAAQAWVASVTFIRKSGRVLLLAIDTCGAVGGVALGGVTRESGSGVRLWSRELVGKTYSELLLGTVDELLSEAKVSLAEIAGVVVIHGPGSFTGIRIGVSAAKGLAEGLAIPVIAVSRLELLAARNATGSAAAILDAGRGEFYVGLYREGVRQAEFLATRELIPGALEGLPVLICEERVLQSLGECRPELVAAPSAADALRVGAERFRAGLFDDAANLDANYLRRSESEMLARIAEHKALREAGGTATSQR